MAHSRQLLKRNIFYIGENRESELGISIRNKKSPKAGSNGRFFWSFSKALAPFPNRARCERKNPDNCRKRRGFWDLREDYSEGVAVPSEVCKGVDEVFSHKVFVGIDGSRHIPLKKFWQIFKFAVALCAGDIENNFYVSIGCRVSSKSKILRLVFL